ncbi:MAG: hypothetical protein ACXVAN_12950, partial [Polyangia bacterium]
CDERMLELYAARVSGTLVLADHKRELVWALWRHMFRAGERRRLLAANVGVDRETLPRTKLHREIESSGENQNILSDL